MQAQRAVALEPGKSYHRVALARAVNKLGRPDEARKSAEQGLQLTDNASERSNAERFVMFLAESTRYAQERVQRETSQKQTSACEAGDASACTEILPGLERSCDAEQARTKALLARACGGGEQEACSMAKQLK